jgi:hypothetical protein
MKTKFAFGTVVSTPGALDTLARAGVTAQSLLDRHGQCDWGDCCPEDAAQNDYSLKEDGQILSSYKVAGSVKVWIITEWDRSVTTVLLPSEY